MLEVVIVHTTTSACTCGQIKIEAYGHLPVFYDNNETMQNEYSGWSLSQQVMRSQFFTKIIGTRAVIKNQQ